MTHNAAKRFPRGVSGSAGSPSSWTHSAISPTEANPRNSSGLGSITSVRAGLRSALPIQCQGRAAPLSSAKGGPAPLTVPGARLLRKRRRDADARPTSCATTRRKANERSAPKGLSFVKLEPKWYRSIYYVPKINKSVKAMGIVFPSCKYFEVVKATC